MFRGFRTNAAIDPNYGRGEHEILEVDFLDPTEILPQLRAMFGSPNYRPPVLPAIALQVNDLTRRPDTSIGDVVATVRRDAMLAADVLRRAQSPMFASKMAPKTLEDAATRMGMKGLRDLVFEVALSGKVFRAKGLDAPMDSLRKHSLLVGYCAQAVAQFTGVKDDSIFLCGLLHDVGLVASLHALAASSERGKPLDLGLSAGPLRDIHVEAGAVVVHLWNLPTEIQLVISAHHHPFIGGGVHPSAACVVLGEQIANALGGGVRLGDVDLDAQPPQVLVQSREALGLDVPAFEQLTEHLRKQFRGG